MRSLPPKVGCGRRKAGACGSGSRRQRRLGKGTARPAACVRGVRRAACGVRARRRTGMGCRVSRGRSETSIRTAVLCKHLRRNFVKEIVAEKSLLV